MALVGTTEIAKKLNQLGYLSKNGEKFSGKAVLRIIRNPIYKGFIKNGKILIKGLHEGYVEEGTWKKIQGPCLKKGGTAPRALLTGNGLIECGFCGSPVTFHEKLARRRKNGTWAASQKYYRCSHRLAGRECPDSFLIRDCRLDEPVSDFVCELASDEKRIAAAHRRSSNSLTGGKHSGDKLMIQKNLQKAMETSSKILEAFESGAISMAQLQERNQHWKQTIEMLERRLAQMEAQSSVVESIPAEKIMEAIRAVRNGFRDLPLEKKRDLLATIFKRIILYPNRAVLELFFSVDGKHKKTLRLKPMEARYSEEGRPEK